ncbi:hypothetical protein G4B88_013437 [Cannabis sativa]|uniref:Protein GUCD1 n=1 Tax=Cannabis sativa TaxID=3483 RepID=A0A7J6HK96_CANSA|nr:hypothetical protein G4B88_013437 [Cannabis sativa]
MVRLKKMESRLLKNLLKALPCRRCEEAEILAVIAAFHVIDFLRSDAKDLSLSLMWPLYILFNKNLKAEEEAALSKRERSSFLESYPHEKLSTNGKCSVSVLPSSYIVDVPHVNQLYSWDCGLACVLMVFRTFSINVHSIESLAELCCTTSIWTVDLAYLLQKFSVSFSYYTVTFGANPNYSVETFYKVIHSLSLLFFSGCVVV